MPPVPEKNQENGSRSRLLNHSSQPRKLCVTTAYFMIISPWKSEPYVCRHARGLFSFFYPLSDHVEPLVEAHPETLLGLKMGTRAQYEFIYPPSFRSKPYVSVTRTQLYGRAEFPDLILHNGSACGVFYAIRPIRAMGHSGSNGSPGSGALLVFPQWLYQRLLDGLQYDLLFGLKRIRESFCGEQCSTRGDHWALVKGRSTWFSGLPNKTTQRTRLTAGFEMDIYDVIYTYESEDLAEQFYATLECPVVSLTAESNKKGLHYIRQGVREAVEERKHYKCTKYLNRLIDSFKIYHLALEADEISETVTTKESCEIVDQ